MNKKSLKNWTEILDKMAELVKDENPYIALNLSLLSTEMKVDLWTMRSQ